MKTQEQYFEKIQESCAKLSIPSNEDEGIREAFASMSLTGEDRTKMDDAEARKRKLEKPDSSEYSKELSILLEAMRKLREGIVASHRFDAFALRVYMFVIRTTILLKHMPSYHPALLYLLHNVHAMKSLSRSELDELIGYHILDLACRQNDLAEAFAVKHRYSYRNHAMDLVLKALIHENWFAFWKMKMTMGVRERYLMGSADDRVRGMALKALGKAYLKIQVGYFVHATNSRWGELKEQDKLGWVLDGETIILRRMQRS